MLAVLCKNFKVLNVNAFVQIYWLIRFTGILATMQIQHVNLSSDVKTLHKLSVNHRANAGWGGGGRGGFWHSKQNPNICLFLFSAKFSKQPTF